MSASDWPGDTNGEVMDTVSSNSTFPKDPLCRSQREARCSEDPCSAFALTIQHRENEGPNGLISKHSAENGGSRI
jgi:hypothetical protein